MGFPESPASAHIRYMCHLFWKVILGNEGRGVGKNKLERGNTYTPVGNWGSWNLLRIVWKDVVNLLLSSINQISVKVLTLLHWGVM